MSTYLETFSRFIKFEKRYSQHTADAYLSDVDNFLSFTARVYEIEDPEMIRHTHIRSWMVELLESGLTPRSVNRKLSSLRSFFRLMRKLGKASTNPLSRIQPPKGKKALPDVIDERHLAQLSDYLSRPADFPSWRDRMVIEMLYGLGIRQAELIGLEVDKIDFQKSQIRVLGKRQKERIVPFGKTLRALLVDYIEVRSNEFDLPGGRLILTDKGKPAYPKLVYRIVHRYLSAVSTVAKRSPHVLRHSYATHMLEAGASIEAIKELLGHASLAATQVYTRTSIERLKKTYRQAHPKA